MKYAKLSEVKEGDVLVVDGDFTCMEAGKQVVYRDTMGLYIPCEAGNHYLDGQEDENGYLVGISLYVSS